MKRLVSSLLLVALLASSQAFALTYTEYTDRAAFESAITGAMTEDFNAEAVGGFTTRVFSDFTVTNMDPGPVTTSIDSGTGDAQVNGTNYLRLYSTGDNLNGMDLELAQPVGAIGFDWRNTDGSGDRARMVIIVDGAEFIFGAAQSSGFFGVVATEGAFGTVKFSDTPGNGTALTQLGLDDITYTSSDPVSTARFAVTKTFEDLAEGEVEVTLTCNGGLPLQQSFTIAGGGPGVTFTVTDMPAGGADCEVTETSSVDNYTPSYDNGSAVSETSCAFSGITTGAHTCTITNTPVDAEYTVNAVWELDGPDTAAVDDAEVHIVCDQDNGGAYDNINDIWVVTAFLDDGESETVSVDTSNGEAKCWAVPQELEVSGVSTFNGCGPTYLSAGEEESCEITYSLFFEGIPTLSQYGMALMALLMLGVGMVGFRRFA